MKRNIWVFLLLIIFGLIFYGCGNNEGDDGGGGGGNSSCGRIVDGEGEPSIEFTKVPPLGSLDKLEGRVSHVASSEYQVVVYIYVEGAGWWIKPYFDEPTTPIRCDGTWTTDIVTGGSDEMAKIIAAYLIPKTYAPPRHYDAEELDKNSVASTRAYR